MTIDFIHQFACTIVDARALRWVTFGVEDGVLTRGMLHVLRERLERNIHRCSTWVWGGGF